MIGKTCCSVSVTYADHALRYHGKCLKIARGKVKEGEEFTCPICDWRVKIPRDAARPKLEDLMDWQADIQMLPFQPEEEDVLDRIIGKALDFRSFVAQFLPNPNNVSGSTEEKPMMLFYLRKLEGAEVLLTSEINTFRQELHKWQPIAPIPPPILNESLSTRKPRPTKAQKIMAQYGVSNFDDLPSQLKAKSHIFKRKSTDNAGLILQPSGRASLHPDDATSPTDQLIGRGSTPGGMDRQVSAGNVPSLSSSELPSRSIDFSHGAANYGSPGSPLFSPSSTSIEPLRGPIFSGSTDGFRSASGALPMFDEPEFDRDLRASLAGAAAEAEKEMEGSPPPPSNVDEMFAEMTNQEPDTQDNANEEDAANASNLENETSHTSEALDALHTGDDENNESKTETERSGLDDFLDT